MSEKTMSSKSLSAKLCCLLLIQSACVTTGIWQSLNKTGPTFVQLATEAGEGQLDVPGDRRGQACSHNVLGIVSFGDSSIAAAKQSAGIERLSTIDYGIVRILSIYGKMCTIVTGSGSPDPGINWHAAGPPLPVRPPQQERSEPASTSPIASLIKQGEPSSTSAMPDEQTAQKDAPKKSPSDAAVASQRSPKFECQGLGCLRSHATDKADDDLSRDCSDGFSTACSALAYRLVHRPEAAEVSKGAALYASACKLANLAACSDWATCLMEGIGTQANPDRAAQIFDTACQAGNGRACLLLGRYREHGRGASKDLTPVGRLYRQACDAGETSACEEN